MDLKVKMLAFVIKMNNRWIRSWWNWLAKKPKLKNAFVNEKDTPDTY